MKDKFKYYSENYLKRCAGKTVLWDDCGYIRTVTIMEGDGKRKRPYINAACNPYADTCKLKITFKK